MSFQDHLKTCPDCRGKYSQTQKPIIKIKGAASQNRERKLSELASIISGTSYSTVSYPSAKGASSIEKSQKLKELAMLIRG